MNSLTLLLTTIATAGALIYILRRVQSLEQDIRHVRNLSSQNVTLSDTERVSKRVVQAALEEREAEALERQRQQQHARRTEAENDARRHRAKRRVRFSIDEQPELEQKQQQQQWSGEEAAAEASSIVSGKEEEEEKRQESAEPVGEASGEVAA